MASVSFDKGIVKSVDTTYIIRAHNSDSDALANNATSSTFVEATFYGKKESNLKRVNSEKVLSWNGFKYLERFRNIRTQKDILLHSGAVVNTDTNHVKFLTNCLNRSVVWISSDNGTTWEQAICNNDQIADIYASEYKEYQLSFTFSEVKEANP